ncbi:unnamed protein product [Caenorhabditis auriculariae]|uniref:Uncharacterized protein n=1 Tax=Caenorhabditis auriculariae TaxID=2777116 RepID=A0A8S1HWM4_9PELO|nr:unnamed protein product [Caenorhabditis auriculariae]
MVWVITSTPPNGVGNHVHTPYWCGSPRPHLFSTLTFSFGVGTKSTPFCECLLWNHLRAPSEGLEPAIRESRPSEQPLCHGGPAGA